MTRETISEYDPVAVRVSKAVANVLLDLEEGGFDDRTWFRAKFICPDSCAEVWILFDNIDRAYSEHGSSLLDAELWDAFGAKIIMPFRAKCMEIARAINGPSKK